MSLITQIPVTVLYRGDLCDTAILVGLVQSRIAIGLIVYIGPTDKTEMDYVKTINTWLKNKGQPTILINPILASLRLERVLTNPLQEWGWNIEECKTALKLAGIPLPEIKKRNNSQKQMEY